jgi:cell division protein FtsB
VKLVAAVAVLLVLGTFVFPTRTFLSQRTAIAEAELQLEVLEEQNARLGEQAASLRDDAEIERLAREQYNLVRPGEEAYALLPSPEATGGDHGGGAAADEPADDRNPVRRVWDALTGLF